MNSGSTKSYKFSFPNVINNKDIHINVAVAAASSAVTRVGVTSLGSTETLSYTTTSTYISAVEKNATLIRQSSNDNFTVSLRYTGNASSDKAALNYISVNAYRKLRMSGSYMSFRNIENISNGSVSKFMLSNSLASTQIWDVTDMQNITSFPIERNLDTTSFVVNTSSLVELLAVNPSGSFLSPEVVGNVTNQNLHGLSSIDYIIISHPDFLSEANRLAEAHRERDELNIVVITPEQIYNEFSSGNPDATAYRWLMKMLYDRGGGDKYFLLFVEGAFDNKVILASKTSPSQNFILTYQSYTSLYRRERYVSVDYFVFCDDNDCATV